MNGEASFDPADTTRLRGALGRFATGVTVITAMAPDGSPIGFTANSFNSVSLDPPLILWSLARSSPRLGAYRAADAYAVNVLGARQSGLARTFASRTEDRFARVDWRPGLRGAPVLEGAIAVFECGHEAVYPAGDHELFIGRVERCTEPGGPPLTFFGGDFGTVMGEAPLSAEPDPLRRAATRAAETLGRGRAAALAGAGVDEALWSRFEALVRAPRAAEPGDSRLMEAGLAAVDARDGRLRPTEEGRALLDRIGRAEAEWEAACAADLATEEAATLRRLLARIRTPD